MKLITVNRPARAYRAVCEALSSVREENKIAFHGEGYDPMRDGIPFEVLQHQRLVKFVADLKEKERQRIITIEKEFARR